MRVAFSSSCLFKGKVTTKAGAAFKENTEAWIKEITKRGFLAPKSG